MHLVGLKVVGWISEADSIHREFCIRYGQRRDSAFRSNHQRYRHHLIVLLQVLAGWRCYDLIRTTNHESAGRHHKLVRLPKRLTTGSLDSANQSKTKLLPIKLALPVTNIVMTYFLSIKLALINTQKPNSHYPLRCNYINLKISTLKPIVFR